MEAEAGDTDVESILLVKLLTIGMKIFPDVDDVAMLTKLVLPDEVDAWEDPPLDLIGVASCDEAVPTVGAVVVAPSVGVSGVGVPATGSANAIAPIAAVAV